MYTILKAENNHLETITHLAMDLWPGHDYETLKSDLSACQNSLTAELYICEIDNQIVGFAQVQLRYDYVEGTETKPVGYLEGIFVQDTYRQKGIARKLVEACQDWSKTMGASEFASDVQLNNETSAAFHERMGFTEVNRIICYAKKL